MTGKPLVPGIARIIEMQASQAAATDINAAVLLALSSLTNQIYQLYSMVQQMQAAAATNATANGYSTINTTTPTLTNKSGSDRINGEVVIRDITTDEAFTVTATAGDPTVLGVVFQDSPDGTAPAIANNAQGMVCCEGLCNVLVNASVAAIAHGDYLIAHSTPGQAVKASNVMQQGVFAIALESKATGTGNIYCYVGRFPKRDFVIVENATPSDNHTCAISTAPYASPSLSNPCAVVIDNDTGKAVFATSLATMFPGSARCVLSNTGSTLHNAAADWNVGSNNLSVIYVPAGFASTEIDLQAFAIISAFMQVYGGIAPDLTPYLKKDQSNGPITGNVNISKAEPLLTLTNTGASNNTFTVQKQTASNKLVFSTKVKQPAVSLPGYAIDVTGGNVGSYINIAAGTMPTDFPFSISFPVKLNELTAAPPYLFRYKRGNINVHVTFYGYNYIYIKTNTGNCFVYNGTIFPASTWCLCTISFASSDDARTNCKLYINAVEKVQNVADDWGSPLGSDDCRFGENLKAGFDEMVFYDHVISQAGVDADYNSGAFLYHSAASGLVDAFHLDEDTGTTFTGINSNTGALNGTASWITGPIDQPDMSVIVDVPFLTVEDGANTGEAGIATLGFTDMTLNLTGNTTKENVANKKTTLADNSDTYYPSQKAVKTAVDAKQDVLVSGTNIKTINSNALPGSGNITVATLIGYTPENVAAKGAVSGYAGLDGSQQITNNIANISQVPAETQARIRTALGTDMGKRVMMDAYRNIVVSGTALAVTVLTTQPFNYMAGCNSPYHNGDILTNGFVCAAGTYSLDVLFVKQINSGKVDCGIDGTSIFTALDCYNGTTLANQVLTTNSIVLTAGLHYIRFTLNGKNNSSGGYAFYSTAYVLYPASDI